MRSAPRGVALAPRRVAEDRVGGERAALAGRQHERERRDRRRAAPRSASAVELVEQLGDRRGGPGRRRCAAAASRPRARRRVNTTPDGLARMASKSASPASRPSPSKPARATDVGVRLRAAVRRAPQDGRGRARRRAASARACGRARPARAGRARAWRRRRRRTPRRTSARPSLGRRAQRREVVLGRPRRAPRTAGRGSPARRACPAAARAAGGGGGRRCRGKSKLKNVASHFSNCDGAGST